MAIGLAALIFSQTSISLAGFSSERLGILHVPIGGETATKAELKSHELSGTPYPAIEVPMTTEQLFKLLLHPKFALLTGEQINSKIVEIRKAVLCAVDTLSKSDPETAEGLQRLYRNGMISVGITLNENVNSAIRDDGKKEFNLEPINLYNPPCSSDETNRFLDGFAGQFELLNDLANLGFHARQDALGPRDGNAVEVELDVQCRQVAAAEGELVRIAEMERIINQLVNDGSVPDDVKGMYREMAKSLVILAATDPVSFLSALGEWQTTLTGMKFKANYRKKYWEKKKRVSELRIANHPAGNVLRAQLRQQGLFEDFGRDITSGLINRWYANEVTGVDESGANPFVIPSNRLTQYVPGLTVPETFAVEDLDTICAGYVWEEENKAFVGGIRYGAEGALDEGRVVAYDLDPISKRIIPESARLSFGTTEMGGGYVMGLHGDEGTFYATQPGTGIICRFVDTNDDKEPDFAEFAGQFVTGPLDIKPDLGAVYFPKGDTAVALDQRADAPFHLDDRIAITRSDHGLAFEPQPDERIGGDLCQSSGFDGQVSVGAQYLALAGSPSGNFKLYDRGTMIAQGCFSPNGFASPHLANPLSPDSELWINDEKTGSDSVRVKPQFSLGDLPKADIVEDNDYSLSLGIRYELDPKYSFKLQYGDSLEQIDSQSVSPGYTNRAGWGYMEVAGNDARTRFFRGLGEPLSGINPLPDTFQITPGLLNYFDVSKNDNAPPAARYELVETPEVFGIPFTSTGFKFFPDGSFFLGFPTFAGSVTFKYRLCVGDYVSPDIVVFVEAFGGPGIIDEPIPVGEDEEGNPLVQALFLEIGGLNYPLCQFRMGPPELITLTSGCFSIHWHGGPAYPFEDPFATPIIDLLPTYCGFGTLNEIPIKAIVLPKADWDFFKSIHP